MNSPAGTLHRGENQIMGEAKYGNEAYWRRLLLVTSSMSPLFILWAIRGSELMPNRIFIAICAVLFIVSNAYLLFVVFYGRKSGTHRKIHVESADDRRHDIISYLFAMMLPFYTVDLDTVRNFAATAVAFLIVVVLFASLNLHYMNFWIALFGYHSFQVTTKKTPGQNHAVPSYMVVTKRPVIRPDSEVRGTLVGVTVLLEGQNEAAV